MLKKWNNIYSVILAAGSSSRFASPKQLLEWRGRNLVQHTLQLAQSLFYDRVVVVLGANASAIRATVSPTLATIVDNINWQQGMSTSIRTGIETLPKDTEAVMLLLCDQPLLKIGMLEKMVILWQQQPELIVASRYNNTIGVPAIFPTHLFPQLRSLNGDAGAKNILMSLQDHLITVAIPEAGIDIDTQDDFAHLQKTSL